jgi:hypothetical protein
MSFLECEEKEDESRVKKRPLLGRQEERSVRRRVVGGRGSSLSRALSTAGKAAAGMRDRAVHSTMATPEQGRRDHQSDDAAALPLLSFPARRGAGTHT